MHNDTQQIWPKRQSIFGASITTRKAPDGTHFALETSFIDDFPLFRIIAANKDFNAVMEKVNKHCSYRLGEVLDELRFRNEELMRTPEGLIENHTVDFVEDVRDERGDAYAYELANNILATQRELGAMHGDDVANDLFDNVADAENHFRNNLPGDTG